MDLKNFSHFLQNCNRERTNLRAQYDCEISKAEQTKKLLDRAELKIGFAEQLYSKLFEYLLNPIGGTFVMKLNIRDSPLFSLYDTCNTMGKARKRVVHIMDGMGFPHFSVRECDEEGYDTVLNVTLF